MSQETWLPEQLPSPSAAVCHGESEPFAWRRYLVIATGFRTLKVKSSIILLCVLWPCSEFLNFRVTKDCSSPLTRGSSKLAGVHFSEGAGSFTS